MLSLFTWHAAYGSSATHMVTDEALAERRAALEGDPGTDNAVKVNMPQEASMHQAQPVEQPEQPLETRVGTSCSCQKAHGSTALLLLMAWLLHSIIFVVVHMGCSLAIQMCSDLACVDCCKVYMTNVKACAVIAAGTERACNLHAD